MSKSHYCGGYKKVSKTELLISPDRILVPLVRRRVFTGWHNIHHALVTASLLLHNEIKCEHLLYVEKTYPMLIYYDIIILVTVQVLHESAGNC